MIVLLAMGLAVGAQPDWDGLRADDGWRDLGERRSSIGPVNVRTKKVDGVGCVEGRAAVDVPAASMTVLARDMVSALEWSSADLADSQVIEQTSGDEFVLYQYYDAPGWTLTADRYWVIRGTATAAEGSGGYRYERVPATDFASAHEQAMARSKGAIEPPINYGEWMFTEDGGTTRILYRSCADVGGRIPDSLMHWLNTTQVPNMIADFVTEAAKR